MKNLKMAQKLGVAFGGILLITCLLGYLALSEMNESITSSEDLAEQYLPELTGLAEVERAFRSAMLHIRTFNLSEDEKAYEAGLKEFENVRNNLAKLKALADKYPQLKVLVAFVPLFDKAQQSYATLARQSHDKIHEVSALRKAIGKEATDALLSMGEVSQMSREAIKNDLAKGETDDLALRVDTMARAENAMTAIVEARMLVWQAQLQNDMAILRTASEKLSSLRKELETLEKNLAQTAARSSLEQARKSVQVYSDGVIRMQRAWEELAALGKQRNEASGQANSIINENAVAISKIVTDDSIKSVLNVKANQKLFSGILAGAIILSVIIALVLARIISGPLHKSVTFAQAVAGGQLDEVLHVQSRDEVGILADALRSMVTSLKAKILEAGEQTQQARKMGEEARAAMEEAKKAQAAAESAKREGMLAAARQLEGIVEIVSSAATELAAQVEESERGAGMTSERITETATAMEEMNATVLEVARSAGNAAGVSVEAKQKAEGGAGIVDKVVSCIADVENQSTQLKTDMTQLGNQAEAIGTIMNVISDIADQTNLLALNAAIEAARAGDAGRGFAVVADEVRKLAEKTMQATVEVGNAIKGVQQSAEKNMRSVDTSTQSIALATDLVQQAGKALKEIVQLVEASADQVRTIATAAEQQSSTSEEINRSLGTISNASSETARAMTEAAQAVSDLSQQAQRLSRLIDDMKRG